MLRRSLNDGAVELGNYLVNERPCGTPQQLCSLLLTGFSHGFLSRAF